MAEQELKDPLEQKYADSLSGLPRFKCGRLDMNTYLPDPVRVGRVESDVVRYIYFDDGEEAIVLGQRADEIAFAAAQYHALTARLSSAEAEVERLRKIAADAFGFLPVVPGDAMALVDSNIVPHVVRVADEYAIRSEQLRLSNAEAEVERLRTGIDEALKWIGSAGISQGSRNMHNKVKTAGDILAAARRQQGGTDAR